MASTADLNEFSQRFAERLFALRPDWAPLARVDPEGDSPPGSLLVEVPSPVPGRALSIRTYGNQVTVDFGPSGWHDHFISESGPQESVAFGRALGFIGDLIAERVVVTTRVLFGRPAWSRAVRVEHLRRPRFGQLDVYSWSGSRDGLVE